MNDENRRLIEGKLISIYFVEKMEQAYKQESPALRIL